MELAYARMAGEAGVVMPPTRLLEAARGESYFGVRRFDREGGRRFHVHTFGNLIHANFRIPSCDYGQLLDVTRILTRKQGDVLQAYRRMVFNVLGYNRDDHVKNFSFRMQDEGEWELAPAYDLIYSSGPGGEHSMTVAGEGKAPSRRHLLAVAEGSGVSAGEATSILESVLGAVERWPEIAREAGVGGNVAAEIGESLDHLARQCR